MITTFKFEQLIDSEIIKLPILKKFIGKTFEIIMIEKKKVSDKNLFINEFFGGMGTILLDIDDLNQLRNSSLI
jgi:hypothetical protein